MDIFADFKKRFLLTLDYLAIIAFVFVIYSFALLTEYLLWSLIEWSLQDITVRYSFVNLWIDYAKIGLAFLTIIFAMTHGILSIISQFRMERTLTHGAEDEESD